jgi:hypothetical protein
MPYDGYADQRQIRLEEVVRIAEGRSPSAESARVHIPKETSSWAARVDHARLDLSVCSGLLYGGRSPYYERFADLNSEAYGSSPCRLGGPNSFDHRTGRRIQWGNCQANRSESARALLEISELVLLVL